MKGKHTVFLDEVSMQDPALLRDAIEVCHAYGVQLFITGDISSDGKLYQLGPVSGSREAMFKALTDTAAELGIEYNWMAPMGLFRQDNDKPLGDFLTELREMEEPGDSWDSLFESELFEHIDLSEMMARFDLGKDTVVNPLHCHLHRVTGELMTHVVKEESLIPVRCNVNKPVKLEEADDFMRAFLPLDDSGNADTAYDLITKGMTQYCTRAALKSAGAKYMRSDELYDKTNEINPMMGVTVHNLQGLTVPDDSKLYLVYYGDGSEWYDGMDPRFVYVAGSRVRRRQQLIIVHLPYAAGGGHTGKRMRFC